MIQTFKQVHHWLPMRAHGVFKSFLLLMACLLASTLYAQNTLKATILNKPASVLTYLSGQSVLLKLDISVSDTTKACSFEMDVYNSRVLLTGEGDTIRTNLIFREGQLYRKYTVDRVEKEILLPNNIVPALVLGHVSGNVQITFRSDTADLTVPSPLDVGRSQATVTLSASGVKNTPIRIGETYWLSLNLNIPKEVRDPITNGVIWSLTTFDFQLRCNTNGTLSKRLRYGTGQLIVEGIRVPTDVFPITYTGVDDKLSSIEYELANVSVTTPSGFAYAGGSITINHETSDDAPIFVAPTQQGNGDGTTWAHATTLNMALGMISSTRPIFMKGGTYSLTGGIVIPRGCRIVGGFEGLVAAPFNRQLKTWTRTTTSGLDLCGFRDETIITAATASNVPAITFENVTVTDTSWSILNGVRINPANGANRFLQGVQLSSNVMIEDCIINRTNIAVFGIAANDNNVLIDRCFIVNNSTAENASTNIINYLGTNCYLRNSVIAYNTAGTNCSVIHMAAPLQPGINNHIINCTIASNTAVPVMSALGAPVCQNTIFQNAAVAVPGVFGNQTIVTNNCYISEDALGTGRITPAGILIISNDDKDKVFRRMLSAADFDFRLGKNSPMINAGTAINTDILPVGMPQITKDASGTKLTMRVSGRAIDVGAYEMQLPGIITSSIGRVYVQGNHSYNGWNGLLDGAFGNDDGLSQCDGATWGRALPSIRINELFNDRNVYEIWMADGDYNLDPTTLTNPICIRGGFVGNEFYYDVERSKVSMIRPTRGCSNQPIITSRVPTAFEHVNFTRVVRGETNPLNKPQQPDPLLPPDANTFDGGILRYGNESESYFNACIFDNSVARSGGMIYIESDSEYTFKKTTFKKAQVSAEIVTPATGGGGAIFITGNGALIFDKDCLFEDNLVYHGHGGAIWANGRTTVKLTGKTNLNTAAQSGGMLYAAGNTTIEVDNFSNSATGVAVARADNGGCFALTEEAKLSIKNSDLSNFAAQTNGGVIHTTSISPLDIETTSFSSNSANSGGVIYSVGNKKITLKNMKSILSNSATRFGGFICNNSDNLEVILEGATMLSKNRAQSGGAFYMNGGTLNVTKTEIKENVATSGDGGVLYAPISITAEFFNISDLTKNIAKGNGGAFSLAHISSSITLDTCPVIDANTSDGNGGVVYSLGRVLVSNVSMTNNTAKVNGGAIYMKPPVTTTSSIISSTLTNNSANESGGGFYIEPGSNAVLRLKDLIFSGNKALFHGGAIYTTATLDVDNVKLINNTAKENGGAIYTKNGFKITNPTTMTGNSASGNGGFLAQANDALEDIEISNTVISGSSAGKSGGALSVSRLKSTGLTLANHTAAKGGALYMDRSTVSGTATGEIDLTKSRIVNNKATEGGAIQIKENIAGKIENTLIGFNSADKYSAMESTADVGINFCTIVMNKSEKSLNTTDPAAVKINDTPKASIIKNSIIWGNSTPFSPIHDLQVTPQTVSYSAIQTSNRNLIADSTVAVIAMTKDNMASDKGKNLYGPHFNLTAVEWKNAGYDASRLGDIEIAKKLNFYFESDALPVNRADSTVALPPLDINGEARVKQFLPDMGAFESDRKGYCITVLKPSNGVYGSRHAPELVCNEDFPAFGFINIKTFNDAAGNPITLNETSKAGVYKLIPTTQPSWSYDADYFNYEITKRIPDFTATYFLEGMPVNNPAKEAITAGENVDFNFVKNSKGEISARYKGINVPLGSNLKWRSAVEDIGKNTYHFELAADENYTSASIDVEFIGRDPKDGFILIFNGNNLGFVYPETDTSLNFVEANVGRAFWECPNEALILTLEQIQSNPLKFKMPKKRTILNAKNRDRFVALVATGSGSGNSPANKAGPDKIDEMVRQIADLKTTGMNYVYVDSGTYTAATDSLYGFSVLPNVCLKGETAFSDKSSTILMGNTTVVDTQTVVNLKGRLECIQVSGGHYGVEAASTGSSVDSCVITNAKEAGFVAQPNVKISIDASMIVSNKKDGIRIVDAEGSVKNSIIVNNGDINGGSGVAVKASNLVGKILSLVHCTVANNATELSATRNVLTVANSIIWHTDDIKIQSPIEVINSAIREGSKTTSNYLLTDTKKPDFILPTDFFGVDKDWLTRNWRLNESSICINRANLKELSGLSKDFDLNQRVQVGLPDLGAFETDKKGSSYAVIAPDTATYTGKVVALSMKDDVDYPGLDETVTLPNSIIDAGTYPDITPTGNYWNYNKGNIVIENATMPTVSVSSQTVFSLNSTPLSQGVYEVMAKGVNGEDLKGALDIDKFLPSNDSKNYFPKVNEQIKFEFTTAKNYKPYKGTFSVFVTGPIYTLSVASNNIEYGATLGSALSYTANDVDTLITGTLSMTDFNKVLPVGEYTRDVKFMPENPAGLYNEKEVKNVKITVNPITVPKEGETLVVKNDCSVYGNILTPELLYTKKDASTHHLDTSYIDITYKLNSEAVDTPVHADKYEMIITPKSTSSYTFNRIDSFLIVDSAVVTVEPVAVTTVYGTAPTLDSKITGLIGSDTILVTLNSNWTSQSSAGSSEIKVFAHADSTRDYDVTVKTPAPIKINARPFDANEISVKNPINSIYDGKPKLVTVSSSAFTITENDYTVTYGNNNINVGKVEYTVVFKNNFTGTALGSFDIILDPTFNVVFTETKFQYDGFAKEVKYTITGMYEGTPTVSYQTRSGEVVVPKNAGVYYVELSVKRSGDDDVTVFPSEMVITSGIPVARFNQNKLEVVEPNGTSVHVLRVDLNIPVQNQISIPYRLVTNATEDEYEIDQEAFVFNDAGASSDVVLTLKNDGKRMPTRYFQFELLSVEGGGFSINENNKIYSVIMNDNGDSSKEEKPVDDIVAFTGEENINIDGLTRQGTLKILSGAEGSVVLKISSVKAGQIRCNGFDYNPSTGASINLVKGENAVTVEFIEAINKDDVSRTIIASLTNISPKTMILTPIKIDQKRHITYINNAPIANTDDIGLSFEMPIVNTTINLYVLNNDMPYQWRTSQADVSLKDDLYISSVDLVSASGLKYSIGENGKCIVLDVSACPTDVLLKGITESLKYTLRQNQGGESIGMINLVVGAKQIKGNRILLESNMSTFIAFEDPFKKANKNGLKTKTLSAKTLRDGDSVYAVLSSNVLGYSKSVLSKSYKKGQFIADMLNEEDSRYYFKSSDLTPNVLVQVDCLGATLNDKSLKNSVNSMISTMNIVSAQAIRIGADTGIYMFAKNSTTDSIYVDKMIVNSSGYPCVLMSGNYFGSTPKAYLEYRSEKGVIKKISLPAVKSITVKRNNVNYSWKTKMINFGKTGEGSMVFFRWPKTLSNINHAQGEFRFDLIIDNGSLLAPVKSFAKDSTDIIK